MKTFKVYIRRDNCTCSKPKPHMFYQGGKPVSQACTGCFRWIGHPVHVCLACAQKIMPYEPEIQVPYRRRSYSDVVLDGHPYGRNIPRYRYRHENDSDCQAAARKDRFISPPWPKHTGASRAEWERKLLGG